MAGVDQGAAVTGGGWRLVGRAVLGVFLWVFLLVVLGLAAALLFLWVIHFRHLPTWTVSLAGLTILLGSLLVYWGTMRYLIRRRFQFSLRAALGGTAAVAVVIGMLGHRIQFAARQQRAIWALWQQGSPAAYHLVFGDDSAWFRGLIDRFGFDPFGNVSEVDVRSDATLDVLLEHAEEFPDLETLSFNAGVSDVGLQRLPEVNRFRNLTIVNFMSTPMTDAGLKHLAGWTNLEVLMLNSCTRITDAGLAHVAELPRLEKLFLYSETPPPMILTDAGLAHVGRMHQLRLLYIHLPITDAGLAHLRGLRGLERLAVRSAKITDAGLTHLEALDLNFLSLAEADVTDDGLKHLQGMKNLKQLELNDTSVTDAGLERLAKMPQLESLWLSSPRTTDSGLVHLQKLPRLRELSLEGPKITDAGLAHLQALIGLERLRFDGTAITDAGLEHLKPLHNLRELDFVRTQVTPAGVADLQRAMPKCRLYLY